VPKTIDNDLVGTDHCPGYGSVAKFLATAVMEAGRDTEAMYTFDPVTVTEAMGRNTGWIAAATGLARREPDEAPHLIYVPEIPFSTEQFLDDVRRVHARLGRAFVVVSEGVADARGNYVAAQGTVDAFGHRQLGGVGPFLAQLVMAELKLKCRYNKLDTCQRSAMHFASRTDNDEAYRCGQDAVRHGVAGVSGFMVSLVRQGEEPYHCGTGLVALADVANGVKRLPRAYLDDEGTHVSAALRAYAGPLVLGEVPLRMGQDGLPQFARFRRRPVPRQLPAWREGKG
jgi:6-phosphofructokinase 1